MTNAENESSEGITDEDLPEDLRPTDENPLAEPLDDDVDPADLDTLEGKGAEQWDDEELED